MTKTISNFAATMLLAGGFSAAQAAEPVAELPIITVHKSATCACCAGWVDYLKDNGFNLIVKNSDDLKGVKAENGLSDPSLQSCHTALVDGYAIEGHVPADDIKRLLTERPKVRGLTAPGMPSMSPGMASVIPKNYDVLSYDDSGKTEIYSSY